MTGGVNRAAIASAPRAGEANMTLGVNCAAVASARGWRSKHDPRRQLRGGRIRARAGEASMTLGVNRAAVASARGLEKRA